MSRPSPPVTQKDLPQGWIRPKSVSSAVVAEARRVRFALGDEDYGRGKTASIDGKTYAFRAEPHYDDHVLKPDGSVGKWPTGARWHLGVSVWQASTSPARDPGLTMPDGLSAIKTGSALIKSAGLGAAGAALGFALGGPIGAITGFAAGAWLGNAANRG